MKLNTFLIILLTFISFNLDAQKRGHKKAAAEQTEEKTKSVYAETSFSGFKFRNVGPAFSSGRIADIAIHPDDDNVWYVAVGSGGVWKTKNAGVTWKTIFDSQPSYSIGCVTIDPSNPHIIWVGTGENVGGRHVGYGDGIYKSMDGGKSWKNMGLKDSEHLSKIIVHPENSNVIWVAAQGPLWSKGGERGLYKSTDGGKTWKKTLGDDEWTGVTEVVIDPRNPDHLYAATWQRHRNVAAYMGGGPGSGLHRSLDGGETWQKLTKGIPRSNLGKIGLAISPQQPDILYAAIETDRKTGGVWKSMDRGSSWSKQSSTVSGGTGPHYYQELYACPHQFERLYLMDVRVQVSDNGGKNFRRLNEGGKHSDNHAIAWRMDDPDYLLIGSDGGLYESFDLAANWRFIDNMPITQYYKVAVDDAEPFYTIYGGTQDNGSHGGPSRTDNSHGIRNADWYKTLGADGHQSATEPGNVNIMYAETQQGGLHRVDRITGEQVYIQPQPGAGEDYERYNWDAPILVSPFSPSRLYFASQRVWRSDNRGDSWIPISGDLTRDQERIALPIMGKVQSWENPWDVNAMSNYNTITSLAESPLQEGLIYAGTDDGIVQVTEDGGNTWRKIEVGTISGVPATAFVNDIKADLYDANTVYVALDNHKYGDFKPYIVKSTDRGNSWTSISSNIPERTLVWRIVQDHVKSNLMFAATEFGIYFTPNGGDEWIRLKGGLPTISFRDLVIQKRENDLVCASFGRSFYVLDDYSALREITEDNLKQDAALFSTRTAWWYRPRSIVSSQGNDKYVANNPPFGAVFTYHVGTSMSTLKGARKKEEKEMAKNKMDVAFPGWDALEKERREEKPKMWLTVKDADGNIVNKLSAPSSKGFHRVAWNLRYASKSTIRVGGSSQPGGRGFRRGGGGGAFAMPGNYSVSLSKEVNGEVTQLAGPVNFEVKPLRKGALEGSSYEAMMAFMHDLEDFSGKRSQATYMLNNSRDKVQAMQTALNRTNIESASLKKQLYDAKQALYDLDEKMNGNRTKREIGEKTNPTISSRFFTAYRGASTTYGPTEMHKQSLDIAKKELADLSRALEKMHNETIPELEKALMEAGAPWIEGQLMERN